MEEWQVGDYVKGPGGKFFQVIRAHEGALYLQDILSANRLILPKAWLCHVSPKETAKALMEAWLRSDFFAME